jgi:hypothetical protein
MKKSSFCLSILLATGFCIFGCGGSKTSTVSQPPTPPGKELLTQAPPDCPAEISTFAGKWTGRFSEFSGQPKPWFNPWNGINESLYISPFKEGDRWMATAIHCWGDSPEWGKQKGYKKRTGAFENREGKPVLTLKSKSVIWTLAMSEDGSLVFTRLRKRDMQQYVTKLKRG